MAITKWWRLAIATGVSECMVYAEAKYCAFEIHGEPKYYVCPKTEYCCNFGCCVSPGFQMYHLWYYWLLVIIMFLVCSGGGWWYRYWLHGRFRTTASTIPNRTTGTRTQSSIRDSACRAQQARISYNTARNTVLLHRMWKAHRGVTSPAYSAAGPASSNTHYQNTSVVLNDVNCPYYQLYGPPPSYETVIAQSRAKLSTPSSPELLHPVPGQSSAISVDRPAHPIDPSGYVGPCSFYSGRSLEAPQYQSPAIATSCSPPPPPPQRLVEGFDTAEYVRLLQQQQQFTGGIVAGPTIMASPRHHQLLSHMEPIGGLRGMYDVNSRPVGGGFVSGSKSSDNSDAETTANCSQAESPEANLSMFPTSINAGRMDCLGHTCTASVRSQQPCYNVGKSTYRVGVHEMGRRTRFDPMSSSSQTELPTEPSTSSSSSDMLMRSEMRRIQGGSLKIPRRRELRQQQQQELAVARAIRRLSSANDYLYHQLVPGGANRLDCTGTDRSQKQIPSSGNNVIAATGTTASRSLAVSTSKNKTERDDNGDEGTIDRQQLPKTTYSDATSILFDERSSSSKNSNVENKRKKLDRSKSLD